jgi:MoxR-like ATPase
MSDLNVIRKEFLQKLKETGQDSVSRTELNKLGQEVGLKSFGWFTKKDVNKLSRGQYKVPQDISIALQPGGARLKVSSAKVIPFVPTKIEIEDSGSRIANVTTELAITNLVPDVYDNYVPFGNFADILSIVKSGKFFPVFVSGHSGNGKTMSIEQACAKLKRKCVIVSMTPETDESDLLGNYVLINGQMEWRDGPVTTAARQGAVLCIDEIDYGAQNLSCLQRVLEGKPFLLKKKGELVAPSPGFTVFATANTKGKGSDDGRYMFTNILNEAFLERFRNTYEQEWPPASVEKKIIIGELAKCGLTDDDFATKLVTWADAIRKTFAEGGCDEVVSTRRLVQVVETLSIFGDKTKSLELCLNRFDDETKISFLDLYTKVDAGDEAFTIENTEEEKTDEEVLEEIKSDGDNELHPSQLT